MTASAAPNRGGLPWLSQAGELPDLMRHFDWGRHPCGTPDHWPAALRTALTMLLDSTFGMALAWSPDYYFFYNDPYRPILGATKHPTALGRPIRDIFPEIWPFLQEQFGHAMHGQAVGFADLLLELDRNNYLEECYFTFSYSPWRDEDGQVVAVLVTVQETTERVIRERRLRTLHDLGAIRPDSPTLEATCQAAAAVLAQNPHDLPCAALYLINAQHTLAQLAGVAQLAAGSPATPEILDLTQGDRPTDWPLASVVNTAEMVVVTDLNERFGALPGGAWPAAPQSALVLPIVPPGRTSPAAVLAAAISPRRALDAEYRSFLALIGGQIGAALVSTLAIEEERRRAAALAELDRAKTTFFSNVSHEFRTPLTLLLGPLEGLLALPEDRLAPQTRQALDVVYRNGLRLLKLVNTLLDFARLEAGRIDASYEPVDLPALTTGLAAEFQPAMERAGLRLVVDCQPLPEPVYVDRGMWEKIVFNLLSNALKFTLQGEVEVSLRPAPGAAELKVRDTGLGIAPDDLPHIFEPFFRTHTPRARTAEGTGLGLPFVSQLVNLHGGTIQASSDAGQGTTFTIRLPTGRTHLPPERIGAPHTLAPTTLGAEAFLAEALRWVPETAAPEAAEAPGSAAAPAAAPATARPLVLVVDDNADMRQYLRQLLSPAYRVAMAANGEQALAVARAEPPDLVLSDVMMPGLDGFQLLNALRADPRTSGVPVILLSARAGQEARIEGRQAGADDYIVKPFSGRELLSRVQSQLALAQTRQAARWAAEQAAERLTHERDQAARLQAITARLSTALTPDEVIAAAITEGGAGLGARAGTINLLSDDGETLIVAAAWGYPRELTDRYRSFPLAAPMPPSDVVRRREPLWIESNAHFRQLYPHLADLRAGSLYEAMAILPLTLGQRVLGSMIFSFDAAVPFADGQKAFMQALAVLCAQALERARLYAAEQRMRAELEERVQARTAELRVANAQLQAELDERRRLLRQMEAWREAERKRIARDLHDELGGELTGMKLHAAQLVRQAPASPEMEAGFRTLMKEIENAVSAVRRIATELRPAILDDFGLLAALQWQFEDFKARTQLEGDLACNANDIPLNGEPATACFRMFQEALTNVARHAQAHRVDVVVDVQPGVLVVEVRDDGRGMDQPQPPPGRLGLAGMRERLDLIGGRLEIVSGPGRGTTVRAIVPLGSESAA